MKIGFFVLLFPFIYLLIDLYVRFDLIRLYSAWQLLYYGISVIVSTLFFVVGILILNKIKQRKILFTSFLILFCLSLVLSILGSYVFFYFNGFFPNYYTYAYFKNEPQSAFFLLKDTIKFQDVVIFTLIYSSLALYFRRLSRSIINWNSNRKIILGAIAFVGLFSLLVVKIKKYDQCLMVDTNFYAAVSSQLINWDKSRTYQGEGLGFRTPFKMEKSKDKKDFNVIVVVLESMRKQNLGVYGYSRNTTPHLSAFQKSHPEEFFVFEHPYTVSTTTMLAVPAILTGIAPYQKPDVFYKQPIVWDYSSILNYNTFFISSQNMNWYRFDRYYSKEKLGHYWSQEKSHHPFFNDLGIDDKYTINHLDSLINTKDEKPFFGVVQLNSTHYPYTVSPPFLKWKGTYVDDYDNAILYQDHVLNKLMEKLKQSGKLENTVVILTSDHGESLKDHNNIGHVDSYYAETISVPLMVYLPKAISSKMGMKAFKENLSKTTSNIDIAPTIIELLGLEKRADVMEISKNFTGQSLFKPISDNRTLITMNNNEVVHFKVGLSIIKNNLHYIYRMNIVPNRAELYDIKKDKKETKNLINVISKIRLEKLISYFNEYEVCNKYLPHVQ
jgi:glucan phosphoethanolaminetransferase (alkaline phosphatase superfamily)